MVQANCRKCGVTMQFDDDDVPPSGKVVKCTGCEAPVTVMPQEAAAMGLPVDTAGDAPVLELGDLFDGGLGLNDMPTPKRPSPLAGAGTLPSEAAPPTGLAAAAPGILDLPAPKKPTSRLGDLPAPKATTAGLGDLPAPKSPFAERPSSSRGPDDLLAPKSTPKRPVPPRPVHSDLPAPKAASKLGDLLTPAVRKASPPNLPNPKATRVGLGERPTPAKAPGKAPDDLPSPKNKQLADLLMPAAPGDLPKPSTPIDLPAPKGAAPSSLDLGVAGPASSGNKTIAGGLSAADMLAPAEAPAIDLPAPLPAGSLSLDDVGLGAPGSASPGGLSLDDIDLNPPAATASAALSLDDLGPPGAAEPLDLGAPGAAEPLDLGAPGTAKPLDLGPPPSKATMKGGLGLDLAGALDPAPSNAAAAEATAADGGGAGAGLDLGDLGGGGAGAGLDLGDLGGGGAGAGLDLGDLDLGGSGGGGGKGSDFGDEPLSLDGLELEAPSQAPALELDSPGKGAPAKAKSSFDGLELPELGGGGGGSAKKDTEGLSFSKPSAKAAEKAAKSKASRDKKKKKKKGDTGPLELDLDSGPGLASAPLPKLAPIGRKAPKRAAAAEEKEEKPPASRKKKLIIAAAAVGVLALGGGGFVAFTKWQAKSELKSQLDAKLGAAQKNLAAGKWVAAQADAVAALKVKPDNADALAMAVQAHLAPVVDIGTDADKALAKAGEWGRKLQTGTGKGPEVDKANGLRLLIEGRGKQAVKQLKTVIVKKPQDGNAYLFLGWALATDYNHGEAAKIFAKALKRTPKRVAALYGLARAQLALGKNEEARKTLSTLIDLDKNHVGALVALAELAEVSRFGEREKRFLEILERKDLNKADPREVSRAWALAGGEALLAGRVGEAQDRFTKALKLRPSNLDAYVGQARAELAEKRYDNAQAKVTKVLGLHKSHLDAQLTLAEIHLAKGEHDQALEAVEKVLGRRLPIQNRAALTRAHMVRGLIYAVDPDSHAEAEEDFQAALESKFEGDIAPLVALSQLYNATNRGAEAVELLKPIESAARQDSALAVTLGVAYLGANKADLAESWFRTALETRPDDVEAKFQLGIALAAQQKYEDALTTMEEAYKSSGSREDVGIRLATMYASIGKQAEAYKHFEELLAKDEPSINLRSQAGRFFAKAGDTDRAAQMGDSILAEQPKNPAGLYLKGEALMAARKFKKARELFTGAAQSDPQPQFFEGLGRASEGLGELNPALKAYSRALEGEPRYLVARLARARIFVAQRRFGKALEELDKADEVDPKNAKIEFYRGKVFVALKKHDDAIKHLARSLRIDSRPAATHYFIGIAYYNRDKPRKATAALSAATRRARGDEAWLAEAYRVLGYAARSAGNKSTAMAAWRNFLDRADKGSKAVDEVKRLLIGMGAR